MPWQRPDDRPFDRLRPIRFETEYTRYSAGSVLASCGDTKVLCNVTVQEGVPKFLAGSGRGWLTAEYRMLPQATQERQQREFLKLSGRTQEIQRLIGRSLRSSLDFSVLGERTILVDADVIQADAGTRCCAITGGYVALALAVKKLVSGGILERSPILYPVAAVSVGLIDGEPFLDLNYIEDMKAEVDCNVVMTGNLDLIEIQGTAEEKPFSRARLNRILDLAEIGIREICRQQAAIVDLA
ncbi:ribonuclease PH [Pannus brasiliensis CCIBt3594]|uniref:Ribonuclease PH n=1 Tax=Pannus brasiliensis CCIBt3594 TaxID=1427578 RepID=A0AAW9QNL6_9CHRO